MTDNGSAMISGEFTAGLHHLGILHLPTLPYSPHVYVAAPYMFSSIAKPLDLYGGARAVQHISRSYRLRRKSIKAG
jgi:transposase InsO family protein